MKTNSS